MGFIRNRVVNWLAKIAGSPDAEDIAPKEPIEFYLKEIAEQKANAPVVPNPTNNDIGKLLQAGAEGEYALVEPAPIPVLPFPTSDDNGKQLVVENGEYALVKMTHLISFYVDSSGWHCSESYANVKNWIENGDFVYTITPLKAIGGITVRGTSPDISEDVEFTCVALRPDNKFVLTSMLLLEDDTVETHNDLIS